MKIWMVVEYSVLEELSNFCLEMQPASQSVSQSVLSSTTLCFLHFRFFGVKFSLSYSTTIIMYVRTYVRRLERQLKDV